MVKVRIKGVVSDRSERRCLLILGDEQGRIAAIPTGLLEGRAVALRLKNVPLRVPLVHDFIAAFVGQVNVEPLRVEFRGSSDAPCLARFCFRAADRTRALDCLPGDGAALAMSCRIPLFADETLFGRFCLDRRDRRSRKPGSLGPLTEDEVRELTREIENLSAEEFWRRVKA